MASNRQWRSCLIVRMSLSGAVPASAKCTLHFDVWMLSASSSILQFGSVTNLLFDYYLSSSDSFLREFARQWRQKRRIWMRRMIPLISARLPPLANCSNSALPNNVICDCLLPSSLSSTLSRNDWLLIEIFVDLLPHCDPLWYRNLSDLHKREPTTTMPEQKMRGFSRKWRLIKQCFYQYWRRQW